MLRPFEWNVVVAAAWNMAILTPDGIRRRVFGDEQNNPIQIQVPLDGMGPVRVRLHGLVAMVQPNALIVEADEPTYENLGRAMQAAARAVESLRETPFSGVGINVRYRLETLPTATAAVIRTPLDQALSDADFNIAARQLRRALDFNDGRINLIFIEDGEGGAVVQQNFHRDTTSPEEVGQWLALRPEQIQDQVRRIMATLGISDQELQHDAG